MDKIFETLKFIVLQTTYLFKHKTMFTFKSKSKLVFHSIYKSIKKRFVQISYFISVYKEVNNKIFIGIYTFYII